MAKESVYEVVSLLAMLGKRTCLDREQFRLPHQEADEIAAILSGLAKALLERR